MNEQSFLSEQKEEDQEFSINDLAEQKSLSITDKLVNKTIQEFKEERLANNYFHYSNGLAAVFFHRLPDSQDRHYYQGLFAEKYQPGYPEKTSPNQIKWNNSDESLAFALLADGLQAEKFNPALEYELASELNSSVIARILAAVSVIENLSSIPDLKELSQRKFRQFQKTSIKAIEHLSSTERDYEQNYGLRNFLVLTSLVDQYPENLPYLVRAIDQIIDLILSPDLDDPYISRLTLITEGLLYLAEKSEEAKTKVQASLPRFYQLSFKKNLSFQMAAAMILNFFEKDSRKPLKTTKLEDWPVKRQEEICENLSRQPYDGILAYFQTLADLAKERLDLPVGQMMAKKLLELIESIAPVKYQIFYQQEIIFQLIGCIHQVGDQAAIAGLEKCKSILKKFNQLADFEKEINKVIGSLDQTPPSSLSFTDPSLSAELATKTALSISENPDPDARVNQVARLRPISSQEKYQEISLKDRLTSENHDQLEEEIRSRQSA